MIKYKVNPQPYLMLLLTRGWGPSFLAITFAVRHWTYIWWSKGILLPFFWRTVLLAGFLNPA